MISGLAMIMATTPWQKFGLADPFRLKVGGAYVDASHAHANPLVTDFDGDGTQDLLVGQFQDGTLRIYLNKSKSGTPDLKEFTWFRAGGTTGKVPFG